MPRTVEGCRHRHHELHHCHQELWSHLLPIGVVAVLVTWSPLLLFDRCFSVRPLGLSSFWHFKPTGSCIVLKNISCSIRQEKFFFPRRMFRTAGTKSASTLGRFCSAVARLFIHLSYIYFNALSLSVEFSLWNGQLDSVVPTAPVSRCQGRCYKSPQRLKKWKKINPIS